MFGTFFHPRPVGRTRPVAELSVKQTVGAVSVLTEGYCLRARTPAQQLPDPGRESSASAKPVNRPIPSTAP